MKVRKVKYNPGKPMPRMDYIVEPSGRVTFVKEGSTLYRTARETAQQER